MEIKVGTTTEDLGVTLYLPALYRDSVAGQRICVRDKIFVCVVRSLHHSNDPSLIHHAYIVIVIMVKGTFMSGCKIAFD